MTNFRKIRGVYENYLRYRLTTARYRDHVRILEGFFSMFPKKKSPSEFLPGDVLLYCKTHLHLKDLRNNLYIIKVFFKWMIEHEYTTFNPVDPVFQRRVPLRYRNGMSMTHTDSVDLLAKLSLEAAGKDLPAAVRWPTLEQLQSVSAHPLDDLLLLVSSQVPLRPKQVWCLCKESFYGGSLYTPPIKDMPHGSFPVTGQIIELVSKLPSGHLWNVWGTHPETLSLRFKRLCVKAGYPHLSLSRWIDHCIQLRLEGWQPSVGEVKKKALEAALEQLRHPESAADSTPAYNAASPVGD